jgi:hypothetical protein
MLSQQVRKRKRRKETYGVVFQSERRREGEGREYIIVLSSSFLHGGKSDKAEDSRDGKLEVGANETINVFSIASGHLYERFLRWVLDLFRCGLAD